MIMKSNFFVVYNEFNELIKKKSNKKISCCVVCIAQISMYFNMKYTYVHLYINYSSRHFIFKTHI